MKKKKLYISLPISGFSLNAVALEAESYKLMWEEEGFEVVTPFDLSPDSEKPYSYHMGKDIEGLLECDAVYFAPGWVDSKGCNLEYAAAKIYGKTINILRRNIAAIQKTICVHRQRKAQEFPGPNERL